MAGIWVFAENRDLTLELLGAGLGLADKMGGKLVAIALGQESAQEFIEHGADEVLVLPTLAADQPLESCVPVLVEAARQAAPDVFFIGGTARGKEIAARIAAQLDSGLCSGCIGCSVDEKTGQLIMERMAYGGAAIQSLICSSRPQMATIPPRTFEAPAKTNGRTGTILELPVPPTSSVRVVKRTPREHQSVDVTEARIIVCVGRGFEKKEDIDLARQLAQVLGGEVGCSRPVAEELQWLPEEVYLGISGKKVKPDLYVGLGVSGQIQHITGIRDSKVIFAVNRDENAPIFEAADFGIVGDLYDVVPKIVDQLKSALNR